MKLKLIVFSSLLCITTMGLAMEKKIKMPDAQTLQQRLSNKGFGHFAEKTNIVDELAEQEKFPMGIAVSIELSYSDYAENLKEGMPAPMANMAMMQMERNKPILFEALLQDHKEALQKLEQLGVYKPLRK